MQATTTTGETVTFYPNAFLAEYLVVAGGGGGGGTVAGFVSAAHTPEDIDQTILAANQAFEKL